VEIEDPAYQRWVPQAEYVPVAQAFEISKEAYTASIQHRYNEMRSNYPEVSPLEAGEFNAFTPYAFLHHDMEIWLPTQQQKEEAIQQLPYLKDSSFVKRMHDERSNTGYAYIRTPDYYATFNSGNIITPQQRYGLGLVWTPQLGTIFQSQSRTDEAAWGTKADEADQVYEAGDLFPESMMQELEANQPFKPASIKYKLGNHGEKKVTFLQNKIRIEVNHSGPFNEILPLLISDDDQITVNDGRIMVQTQNGSFVIHSSEKENVEIKDYEADLRLKKCKVITISAIGRLMYEFVI